MTQNLFSSSDLNTTTPKPPQVTYHIVGGVWLIVLAAILFSCGACSGLFYLISPLTSTSARSDVTSNTILGATALLTILFGVVLVWQAVDFFRPRAAPTTASIFPSPIVFGVVFLVAVVIGTGALVLESSSVYIFPPWHFIAASSLPLIFLAYAARRLGQSSSLRALFASFSWGALGATPLAFIIEIGTGIVFIVAIAVVLWMNADSRSLIEQWDPAILRNRGTVDPTVAMQLLAQPAIIGIVLAYFALAVPLIEEFLKTLVIAFIDPARTSLANAVLWGIGAGAGFAIVENTFNAGVGLNQWTVLILLRIGATTMHIANGVTMGRGWYAARVERRWPQLFIAYFISLVLHAVWNAAAILMSGGATFLASDTHSLVTSTLPLTLLVGALALVLVILTLLGLGWIVYVVQTVRAPATLKIFTEGDAKG